MTKRCSTCINDAGRRCRRDVWSAGPGVTEEALGHLKVVSADKCFYWESVGGLVQHRSCNGCVALDRFTWACRLGHPVKALRQFVPGGPCPKPVTDAELTLMLDDEVRR